MDILHTAPINRLAKSVVRDGIAPVRRQIRVHNNPLYEICPPVDKFTGPAIYDLTGKKFGRLTVIGFKLGPTPNQKGGWVVRCDCGLFQIRRSKCLRTPSGDGSWMCDQCDYVHELGRGRKPPSSRRTSPEQ